jgi:ribosomal protein S18 acetylase RimI-like enzyme
VNPAFDPVLLSRIEDAGLNASAPPEQRWLDGWLVRLSPGKAKRARCINAVAEGQTSVTDKLALCRELYQQAHLPLHVRVTPFSQPEDLDGQLAARGLLKIDDTRVMVCNALTQLMPPILPDGINIQPVDSLGFAQVVGEFRDSPESQRAAQAKRLAESPVPFTAFVVRNATGEALACGQIATESEFVGLYDVYTASPHRSLGLAKMLCKHMLTKAHAMGAAVAYLQVESDNHAARHIYRGLGFSDAYAYHYRQASP